MLEWLLNTAVFVGMLWLIVESPNVFRWTCSSTVSTAEDAFKIWNKSDDEEEVAYILFNAAYTTECAEGRGNDFLDELFRRDPKFRQFVAAYRSYYRRKGEELPA